MCPNFSAMPPEVMLNVMILQFVFDLLDRQMEEQIRLNKCFRFFLGLR